MPTIRIEYTLNAAQFARASRQMQAKSPLLRYLFIPIILIFLINFFVNLKNGLDEWLLPFLLFVFVWILLLFSGIFSFSARWMFRLFPALRHPFRYEFSEQEIKVNTHNASTIFSWDAVHKAFETDEFFFLSINQKMTVTNFLPKSAFQNEDEIERFRHLLKMKKLLQ